jgi:hypothetical protein
MTPVFRRRMGEKKPTTGIGPQNQPIIWSSPSSFPIRDIGSKVKSTYPSLLFIIMSTKMAYSWDSHLHEPVESIRASILSGLYPKATKVVLSSPQPQPQPQPPALPLTPPSASYQLLFPRGRDPLVATAEKLILPTDELEAGVWYGMRKNHTCYWQVSGQVDVMGSSKVDITWGLTIDIQDPEWPPITHQGYHQECPMRLTALKHGEWETRPLLQHIGESQAQFEHRINNHIGMLCMSRFLNWNSVRLSTLDGTKQTVEIAMDYGRTKIMELDLKFYIQYVRDLGCDMILRREHSGLAVDGAYMEAHKGSEYKLAPVRSRDRILGDYNIVGFHCFILDIKWDEMKTWTTEFVDGNTLNYKETNLRKIKVTKSKLPRLGRKVSYTVQTLSNNKRYRYRHVWKVYEIDPITGKVDSNEVKSYVTKTESDKTVKRMEAYQYRNQHPLSYDINLLW